MDKEKSERIIGPGGSFVVSLVIGAISGLGAVAFRGLIALIHNLLFLGIWSLHYDANQHTARSHWGIAVALIPVLASFGVTFLVTHYAPEAKGHGVPEVMEAVYYQKGIIRPIVVWIKCLASALSIGSGGSVGREGPIVQIGSAIGSWLGGILRVQPWERITWVACGAAGGIAATFNTPIGGILFATELILQEISAKTLIPVAISCATASYVGRIFFGASPSFVIPALEANGFTLTMTQLLPAYALLGVAMGLASAVFIWGLYKTEDLFMKIKDRPYLRHGMGMALIGILMVAFELLSGHYYVQGVGYATIQDVLSGTTLSGAFLLILAIAKLIATSATLGSGASGGIFSPSLFLGATLGGAFGKLLQVIFPNPVVNPAAFAVVGMAAAVGGATGAAVTAIVMIFEMTDDYKVIVPMTIAVAISYGIRILFSEGSIYTMKLIRRGLAVPSALHADVYSIKTAEELMERDFKIVPGSMRIHEFLKLPRSRYSLIEEEGRLLGVLRGSTFDPSAMRDRANWENELLSRLANPNFMVVSGRTGTGTLLSRLRRENREFVIVAKHVPLRAISEVSGILSEEHLAALLVSESEIFSIEARYRQKTPRRNPP